MVDGLRHLDHLYIIERAADEDFTRGGQGNPKIRPVESRTHGLAMRGELDAVFAASTAVRASVSVTEEELSALGTSIVLEGADATYPLKLDSLSRLTTHRTQPKRPMWLLLSVHPATAETPERAVVWVADQYRSKFLQLFEDYLSKVTAQAGNPANQALIANIARIRQAVLLDLWTSSGEPPARGTHWWELWLDSSQPDGDVLAAFAHANGMRLVPRSLRLRDRVVMWIECTWDQLQVLPFTRVPIAEVRRPEFVDTIADLPRQDQDEFVEDLAARIVPAAPTSPHVTHLDSGVFQGHVLIQASLAPDDVHTIVGTSGDDVNGHGTSMAGLALFGDLDEALASGAPVALSHRLESVRIIPGNGEPLHDPLDYGTATADAIARPEITAIRKRVYCLPISTQPDQPGEPTLWSATVDALAAGTDVVRVGDELQLLSAPESDAARLILVAAGNVDTYQLDHRTESDTSAIEDPAQAWNALTVSAFTNKADAPVDPAYDGWEPLARHGELSPHSRTSVMFGGRKWPIKPDICMEGGNVLSDGVSGFEDRHPSVSLRSAGTGSNLALTSANATSAATAQAARLAALAMSRYPDYWPETVRGLLTHSAEWTEPMWREIDGASGKAARLSLLRRYGWGVPAEDAVQYSSNQAVTLVSQDQFVPFDGAEYRMRHFRLHSLPWPKQALEQLADDRVRLRVTLSYFIEPSASRRGWRRRYSYASHGLRFDLQGPLETEREFVARVNRDAQDDEQGRGSASAGAADRWLIGPNQRHLGSLHQDEWTGSGYELAATGSLAVYPVGGWWKNNGRADRVSRPVRYSLLVSLQTDETAIDLYTPIATEIRVPIEIVAE